MISNKFYQLVAGLGLYSTACSVYATPIQGSPVARSQANDQACSSVSSLSASQVSATPSATPVVPAELAVACLQSLPNKKQEALNLTGSFRAYLEFQSDKNYLAQPPPGYLNPAYEIDAFLNQTEDNVRQGKYKSELEFQQDILYTLQQAFDGHLFFQGDILNVFSFQLDILGLVSVSSDGIQLPQVYFAEDIIVIEKGSLLLRNSTKASAVISINGIPVDEALQTIGLFGQFQDPDARYNALLFSPPALGVGTGYTFGFPALGIVPNLQSSYNFTFANGSTTQVPIMASVTANFTGVTDGETAYKAFAPFAQFPADVINGDELTSNTSTTATGSAPSTSANSSSNSTASPNIRLFPFPVVKDSSNAIAGYFLNETQFSDTAVLQLVTFDPPPGAPDDFQQEYAEVLTSFLKQAVSQNKTKLVIDVQSNPGGSIDLGTFVAGQLFPDIAPNAKSNMVRSVGLDLLVQQASSDVTSAAGNASLAAFNAASESPLDFQDNVTPAYEDFASIQDFLNGISVDGANFTSFFQTNYTSSVENQADGFVVFNGSANAKPPFVPENIVVLSNGICSSTCTVFSEHLKNQAGVRFVAVGGRPMYGPMQTTGGIKGAQIFNFEVYDNLLLPVYEEVLTGNNNTSLGKEAPWSDLGFLPIARTSLSALSGNPLAGTAAGGVNGRNAFRIGDNTSTPLQYVYEAADCRLWYTPQTLASPAALWKQTAAVAFTNSTNGSFESRYCVAGSTNQPTSLTGGLKQGEIGPQVYNATIAGAQIFTNAPWGKNASSNSVVEALGFIPSTSGKKV